MNASSAKRQFNEAEALFLRKQYPEALALLTRLNNKFPNQRNIIYPMALCHEQLGRFDEARTLCEELLRHSDYPKAKALLERLEPDVLGGELVEGMDEAHPFAPGDGQAAPLTEAEPKGLLMGFVARLKKRAGGRPRLDPTCFGDPVALKTAWGAMGGKQSSFRSRRPVQVSPERLEYRCSKGALLFCMAFILVGLTGQAYAIGYGAAQGLPLQEIMITSCFFLLFLLPGVCALYMFTTPMVFDKRLGYYWNNRKAPHQAAHPDEVKNSCKISDIHALQLIQGITDTSSSDSGRTHSTTYYELNLVFKSGRRLHIIAWPKPAAVRADGQIIAKFLNVPFWDALVAAQAQSAANALG